MVRRRARAVERLMQEHYLPLLCGARKVINEPLRDNVLQCCVLSIRTIRIVRVVREEVGVDRHHVDISDICGVVMVLRVGVVRHVEAVHV